MAFRFPALCKACFRVVERWDSVATMCTACHDEIVAIRQIQREAIALYPELENVSLREFVRRMWTKLQEQAARENATRAKRLPRGM